MLSALMTRDDVTAIRAVFRQFKRRASLLRDAAAAFDETDVLQLQIKLQSGDVPRAEFLETGDVTRFAALLRPFMQSDSPIELSSVWALLKSANLVNAIAERECSRAFSLAAATDFPVKFNTKIVTAGDIYFAYAEGSLFNSDPAAKKMVRELSSLCGPAILQFLFHSACLNYTTAVFAVLEVILAAERDHADLKAPAVQPEQCIYCLTREGDFSAEEHVIPEAFGLDDIRLCGSVCTKCNNVLSALDQYLADFEPLALLRVQNVPLTKKGKFPKADFRDFTIEKTKPRVLTVRSKTGKDIFKREDFADGTFRLHNTMLGKRPLDAIRLARAVFKVALGLVAFDQGTEYACAARFNAARAFIAGHGVMPNHLLIVARSDVHNEIRTEWAPVSGATPVAIDIFGVRFGVNLEASPLSVPDDAVGVPILSFWLGELTKRGIVAACGPNCAHGLLEAPVTFAAVEPTA